MCIVNGYTSKYKAGCVWQLQLFQVVFASCYLHEAIENKSFIDKIESATITRTHTCAYEVVFIHSWSVPPCGTHHKHTYS